MTCIPRPGRFLLILLVASSTLACSGNAPELSADGTWVGTIATEGNVTTVVNESGSVWGGTARLVEEASIGVESGPDEYMLGQIRALHATDDRILVIDQQVPVVRVYDHAGAFLGNLGKEGQGPGEYTDPVALASDADGGRVFLLAGDLRRINVYSASGESVDTWPAPNRWRSMWPIFSIGDDTVWVPVVGHLTEEPYQRYGGQKVGPDGPFGEIVWVPEADYQPATFTAGGRVEYAPFGPVGDWDTTAGGGIVAGTSDQYRYEVHRNDGSQLIVERFWDPVPIPAERREYERRYRISSERAQGNHEFAWDGSGMPEHMPAFQDFVPTQSGAVWIYRFGSSEKLPDCAEDPLAGPHQEANANRCWSQQGILDAFGEDGRYLGEVSLPPEIPDAYSLVLFVDGDRVVARAQDGTGTYMVKRYRLVLPGEE